MLLFLLLRHLFYINISYLIFTNCHLGAIKKPQINIAFKHSPITFNNPTQNIQLNTITKQPYTHIFLNEQFCYVHSIYFKAIQLITDNSVLPTSIYFYQDKQYQLAMYSDDIDNRIQVIQRDFDDFYAMFVLMRGTTTTRYIRSYNKTDFVLAQIFGFISTISFIIYISYQGYNQWKFQKQELNANININSKKQNINILAYYCEKFKEIFSCICKNKSKNKKQQIFIDDKNQHQQHQQNSTENGSQNKRYKYNYDIFCLVQRIEKLQAKLKVVQQQKQIRKQRIQKIQSKDKLSILTS